MMFYNKEKLLYNHVYFMTLLKLIFTYINMQVKQIMQ